VVLSLWAVYSLLGGFLYGTIKRGLAPVLLLAPMAVLTIPVGLSGGHWWLLAILLLPAGALCAPTITASADAVSRLTPAGARGEAMGLHNSSLTVGVALGGPLAGLAADHLSPPWGFVAVGGAGALIALLVLPTELRRHSAATAEAAELSRSVPVQPAPADTLGTLTPTEIVGAQAGPAGAVPPPVPR
jgi:MFS family permease